MTTRTLVVALVAGVCLVGAACGDDSGGGTPEPGTVVEITAQDFIFSPSSLAVDPGAEVTVEVTNEDGVQHSFTVDDLGVDLVVSGNESGSVTFTAPDSDTVFHCRFHDTMSGTITTGTASSGGSGTEDRTTEEPGYDY